MKRFTTLMVVILTLGLMMTGCSQSVEHEDIADLKAQINTLQKQITDLEPLIVFTSSTSQKRAREIMGINFIGIKEAIRYFKVNPSPQQLVALSEIPFSEKELKELKDTHILVAVFPLSILDIRERVDSTLFFNNWYLEKPFTKERGEVSWQLVRKTSVSNRSSKGLVDPQSSLSKNDEIPTTRIMVYTIIGHYLVTGKRLFPTGYYAYTSDWVDIHGVGYGVRLGSFEPEFWLDGILIQSGGLEILPPAIDLMNGILGTSSARKHAS